MIDATGMAQAAKKAHPPQDEQRSISAAAKPLRPVKMTRRQITADDLCDKEDAELVNAVVTAAAQDLQPR